MNTSEVKKYSEGLVNSIKSGSLTLEEAVIESSTKTGCTKDYARKILNDYLKSGYSNNPDYVGDWFGKGQIDFNAIINPEDDGDVWMVKMWSGSGYTLDVYLCKATNLYDAIDTVFEWSWENEGENNMVFDLDYVYKEADEYFESDPDMYGNGELDKEDFEDRFIEDQYVGDSNYGLFARSENFFVDKVPEDVLAENQKPVQNSRRPIKSEMSSRQYQNAIDKAARMIDEGERNVGAICKKTGLDEGDVQAMIDEQEELESVTSSRRPIKSSRNIDDVMGWMFVASYNDYNRAIKKAKSLGYFTDKNAEDISKQDWINAFKENPALCDMVYDIVYPYAVPDVKQDNYDKQNALKNSHRPVKSSIVNLKPSEIKIVKKAIEDSGRENEFKAVLRQLSRGGGDLDISSEDCRKVCELIDDDLICKKFVKSSYGLVKNSFVIEHWAPLLPQTQYVGYNDEGLAGVYDINDALQFNTKEEAKRFIKEHDKEYGGILKIREYSSYVHNSRRPVKSGVPGYPDDYMPNKIYYIVVNGSKEYFMNENKARSVAYDLKFESSNVSGPYEETDPEEIAEVIDAGIIRNSRRPVKSSCKSNKRRYNYGN